MRRCAAAIESPLVVRRRVRRPLLALVALVVALAVGYGVRALQSHDSAPHPASTVSAASTSAQRSQPLSALPPQAAQTVRLIQSGGPFAYPRNDGAVFHNAEHHLPAEPDGFYHEYTVPTPGSATRGGRRIITGKNGEFYYTGDHYESFVTVDTTR
jgi:guanyl-specific ribonuclease Sa